MTLIFAIDFDNTITACPDLWAKFIVSARESGHRFYLVTCRRDTEENTDIINAFLDKWGCQMPIIFCNLASKFDTLEKRGIKIDIWIDDAPHAIVHGM